MLCYMEVMEADHQGKARNVALRCVALVQTGTDARIASLFLYSERGQVRQSTATAELLLCYCSIVKSSLYTYYTYLYLYDV